MANTKYNKIVFIDTAGASAIRTDQLTINKIRWVDAGAAGDACVIQDQNNNTFWESVASGADYVESDDFSMGGQNSSGRRLDGLKVPTLSSGKLYIYLD